MILDIAFSDRVHKKLIRDWQQHSRSLREAYEPVYHISDQRVTTDAEGRQLLLTDWFNGRPTIMPPADLVCIILFDPGAKVLRSYLIEQPALLDQLGQSVDVVPLPTRFFQVEHLDEPIRSAVLLNAQLIAEKPL